MSYGIATKRALRLFIAPLHNAVPTRKWNKIIEWEKGGRGMAKKKKRRGPAEHMNFYNLKKQYQQNMWPQDVAVGYWRLLRQSVHLLIPPVAWDWKRQRNYKMKLDIHKLLGKGHKKTGNSHHTIQLVVWYWSCGIRVRWTPWLSFFFFSPSFLYLLTYKF